MRADEEVLVERYFAAIADVLRSLPSQRRAEILAELRAHLELRRRESRAGVEAILAELGQPEDIAAEAGLDPALYRTDPRQRRDAWSLVAIIATVFAWPVGLVIAAVSGRWRLRSLLYAGITPLFGWMVGLFVLMRLPAGTMSSSGTSMMQCLRVTPIGAASPVPCIQRPMVVPWNTLHPFLHALGVAGGLVAIGVGLVGGPIVSAIYLARSDRNPAERPWLPIITWAVIAAGILLAEQFGG